MKLRKFAATIFSPLDLLVRRTFSDADAFWLMWALASGIVAVFAPI